MSEAPAVVIDKGSGVWKAGFAGEETPMLAYQQAMKARECFPTTMIHTINWNRSKKVGREG